MTAGFIFGGEGLPKSPKELARLRAVAAAMQPKRAPRDVGEGIYALGSGLASGLTALHANRQEQKGQEGAANAFQSIVSAMNAGGGSSAPSISNEPSTQFSYSGSIPASDTETDPVNRRIDQGFAAFGVDPKPVKMDGTKESFISALMPEAQRVGAEIGVDPRIIVAQAAQETGWGKSAPGNNFFGIKSHGKGGGQNFTTHEVINGKRVKINDSFRMYDSPEDSVRGYGEFLTNNPRYKPMLQAGSMDEQLAALGASGYATDPNYARSVGSIARSIPLPTETASLQTSIQPEKPAIDPTAMLAQRLMSARGQSLPESQPQAAQQAQAMQSGNVRQQPSQGIQRVAQAAQGMDQQSMKLIEAMNNPYMSQGQKAVLGAMLEQRMQSSDPMRQMQLEKAQLELEQMRNPSPEYSTLSAEQVQSLGLPEGVYQRGPKGKISQVGGSGVNVNIGEGDKFYENLDKKNAETFAMLSEGGVTARGKLNQIDRLEGLLAQAPSGMEAGVKQMLGDFGIKSEGLDTIQSTRALLEAMVPQQRPVGSGPMSDADVKMFRNSLPRLINQPGGNELILGTMRGIAQYEAQMGEIADMVADRSLTPSEGRKRIRELENPISAFRNTLKDGGADAPKGQQEQPPLVQGGSASGVGGDFMTRLPNMTREDLQGLDRSKMSLEELKAAAERYRMLVGGEI